ncbi:hypothetical protein T484DRAFT_1799761, partial [Baffinella frigidus]
ADVTKAFEAGDVDQVVIALGGRTKSSTANHLADMAEGKTKEVGEEMLTKGTTNIIAAMKATGVKKVRPESPKPG